MYVTSTSGATQAGQQSQATGAAVDYQAFLKLLVAEMKNQDPTEPMDSTEYVAQLASFSQVEQSVQINKKLDQMLQSSAVAQADALLGHTVTSADGSKSGVVAEVRLTSDGVIAVTAAGDQIPVVNGIRVS
ncbi:MAG: flagellar hook assembly protein FlgD [Rhizobiaceae bacterium]|nr:flagellar hook assembly protein FlgD [Rhizobiaceae bacterium]